MHRPPDGQGRAENDGTAAPPIEERANHEIPAPLDLDSPQLTLRAVLTGVLMGGILSACNIYTGLTIGWSFNMSITAVLLSYAFWQALHGLFGVRSWGIQENNINQTACSSAAAVSSAGLVAPIPALAMLTGQTLDWLPLALWVFSVCLVGIVVAVPVRRQMIVVDRLPFPSGLANGEMLREIYARGTEAVARVLTMLSATGVAIVVALWRELPQTLHFCLRPIGWLWTGFDPTRLRIEAWGLPLPASWLGGFKAKSLTFALDPSLLMLAVGGLIGIRACCSLLGGAILAWLVLAPPLIHGVFIRLKVSEPLEVLPPGVAAGLKPPPQGYASYETESGRLVFRGPMTPAERDELLSLSSDAAYQEAVRRLYVRSQLRLAVPLAQLPAGVDLTGLPVRYDAAAGELVATAGIDRRAYARLLTLSEAAEFRTAVDALYAFFDYTTTRRVSFSAPLEHWPEGLVLPRELTRWIHYDAAGDRLFCKGAMPADVRAGVLERIEERVRRHPLEARILEDFRAAIEAVYAASNATLLGPATTMPGHLAEVVRYDDAAKVFVARGILTSQDGDALRKLLPENHPHAADFSRAVAALVTATGYNPVRPGFADVVEWLLWPGVTLMVVASLVSFGFSWPAMIRAFRFRRSAPASGPGAAVPEDRGEVSLRWFLIGAAVALVLSVSCQVLFFQVVWWMAALGVVLSFVLALVAARVAGETNTTPVGAMGKVTQFVFGVLSPASPATNLMTANVTGGAASQCADLMHDLKTGYMLGTSPRKQTIAQICGALCGSLAGSAFYLMLIPNPREQLMTEQWAAPAVATWKAVAELFVVGIQALPRGTAVAVLIAAALGVLLPVLERQLPQRVARWLPSPAALGLAFVINGYSSISMFLGGLIALIASRLFKSWTGRFLTAICAGLIAGESLTAVGISIGRLPLWEELAEHLSAWLGR